MIDIVYVTYNSKKWIKNCIASLINCNFELDQINVYFVDNASDDDTVDILKKEKEKIENLLARVEIIENDENMGYGKANNIGAAHGNSEIICFFNIDTELFEDSLLRLMYEIEKSDDRTVLWELRQFPYEHPKIYNPVSCETDWASGAAFAVKRNVFEYVKGFDEAIFMYAEDVDLSWRIRCAGYRLKYVPQVRIWHYTYGTANELKIYQQVYSVINNLLLRDRYGSLKKVLCGHWIFLKRFLHRERIKGERKKLFQEYIRHFALIPHFYQKGKYKHNNFFVPYFLGIDYTKNREGAFYRADLVNDNPLVSIIVRTCGRPEVLKETLLSIRNQTYENVEIVVVEDGKNISEKLIYDEFSQDNIVYFATNNKVGRSKAGNLAIERARGKYINFLDDDDLFFADHIETLVCALQKTQKKVAYAIGLETSVVIESISPYKYTIMNQRTVHMMPFDKITLCHHNYMPIQCVMFEKELFNLYGGLDETVDALEDWDLWVRYSLYTDFEYVAKTTSIYKVPHDAKINEKRQKELDDALVVMREKHKEYMMRIDVNTVAELYQNAKY